jgi:deazaflavin-dependent oxidoreductase (nitroreductase family)
MEIRLTTTGRSTGKPRSVILYAWPDGEQLVVVGSSGGAPGDPSWVRNLRAVPLATVTRGREAREYRATEVDGSERERLWQLVTAAFPLYAAYQRRTKRRIPLFALAPSRDSGAGA